jgi:precorrin-2 dehydrogenase / sirohydrochlorin ferrochelatase
VSYLVNLTVAQEPAIVVGAGTVALRKVLGLLEAGAAVTVVAPRAGEGVRVLAESGKVLLVERPYEAGDLAGARLAIAATDDEEVNAQVSLDARAQGVLVNVVDRPALCTFTLPATVRRGDLTLAVATEGRCPALARALREELGERYGEGYGRLVALMGQLRDEMIGRAWGSERIQTALSALYTKGLLLRLDPSRATDLVAFLRAELGEDFPVPLSTAEAEARESGEP